MACHGLKSCQLVSTVPIKLCQPCQRLRPPPTGLQHSACRRRPASPASASARCGGGWAMGSCRAAPLTPMAGPRCGPQTCTAPCNHRCSQRTGHRCWPPTVAMPAPRWPWPWPTWMRRCGQVLTTGWSRQPASTMPTPCTGWPPWLLRAAWARPIPRPACCGWPRQPRPATP